MDLSGRFNFWRMLLYTRAITPPHAKAGLHLNGSRLSRLSAPGWLVLSIISALAVGVAIYVGGLPSKSATAAADRVTATVTHAEKPTRPW
jgi:hypothetical protein